MNMQRAILSFGLFLVIGSLWMLFVFPPGSGEFVVSLLSMASGAVLVAIAITLARRTLRQAPDKEDK